MEKNINKYAIIVRIICYILIPICGFVMLQSIISLAFFSGEKNKRKADSYFETQRFENFNIIKCRSKLFKSKRR